MTVGFLNRAPFGDLNGATLANFSTLALSSGARRYRYFAQEKERMHNTFLRINSRKY
jgi:hypothetical protein